MVRLVILVIVVLLGYMAYDAFSGLPRIGFGERIDVAQHAATGLRTIFVFTSPVCGPSEYVGARVKRLVRSTRGLDARMVDINRAKGSRTEYDSPLAKQFEIQAIPAVAIADIAGKIAVKGPAAASQVFAWFVQSQVDPDKPLTLDPDPTYSGERITTHGKGEKVELSDLTVKGRITVFDFYSDFCPPCRALSGPLEQMVKSCPKVILRRVDINRPGVQGIDWKSPTYRSRQIRGIPHLVVCDESGKVRLEGNPARDAVVEWINFGMNLGQRCP